MSYRFLTGLVGIAIPFAAAADPLWVGRFSETDSAIPSPWKIEHLDLQEQRNVLTDFQQLFGEIRDELRGLAIASDTDSTGEEAHAGFADFRSAETEGACTTTKN